MTTLVLMTALSVLTLNMFLPALPAMGESFGVSEAVMGLAISGYMACAAVFQMSLGALSDRIGRRPVLLGVLALYVVTSLVCLSAQSIEVFLVARAVQAVAVAGGVLSSAVVRDLYDGRMAAAKLGTIATAMAIAPMLAPILGGFLDAWFGWRAIFAAYTIFGLAAFVLIWADLGETKQRDPARQAGRVTALLKEPVFWAYTCVLGFSVGAFFTFLTGAPFVASQVFGLSSDQIGLVLGSITLGYMLGAGISARTVERVGAMPLILVGRGLPLVSLVAALAVFLAGFGTLWVLFAATMTVGFGNGLTVANANAGALAVRPEMAGTAAGLAGAFVLVTGAVLAGLTTMVLSAQATPARLILLMVAAVAVSMAAALLARRWSKALPAN
nr:Bcr/CflA family efflux MFS transporter [Gymnodinialimonas phycosphaerae]